MDVKELLDLGTETLAVFKDHIPLLLVIIVIAVILGLMLQSWVDGREIRGLKAENRGLEADKKATETLLQLAHHKQEAVTAQLQALGPLTRTNLAEIAELKVKVDRLESSTQAAILPQLEKAAHTSVVVTTSVRNVLAANLAVGEILTSPPGKLNLITDFPRGQVTSKSE